MECIHCFQGGQLSTPQLQEFILKECKLEGKFSVLTIISLSDKHTHIHTYRHTHTHTRRPTHTLIDTHIHTLAHRHIEQTTRRLYRGSCHSGVHSSHQLALSLWSDTQTHATRTQYARIRNTHTHIQTHTHTYTHTHTHTHARTRGVREWEVIYGTARVVSVACIFEVRVVCVT